VCASACVYAFVNSWESNLQAKKKSFPFRTIRPATNIHFPFPAMFPSTTHLCLC